MRNTTQSAAAAAAAQTLHIPRADFRRAVRENLASQGAGAAHAEQTLMSRPLHRWVAAAMLAGAQTTVAAQVCAEPTHQRFIERQMPLLVTRAAPRSPARDAVPRVFAPLRYERAAAALPIKMLPLVVPPRPRVLPTLLPLGLAALSAPFDAGRCSQARSGVVFAALPSAPFAPAACLREPAAGDWDDRATSLTAGRNKNALYGPAYSARDFDAP